jgi:lysophospholipase L1-like esterase
VLSIDSGYNTDLALRVISKVIPRPDEAKIRLMTIFFGANDSCARTEQNNQCVPLPEFRSNLIKIIQNPIVAAHKDARIIFITNPPVDERTQYAIDLSKGYPMRRTAENTKRYADAIKAVGKSLNIPVVDIWTEIMLKAGWTPGSNQLPGCTELPPNPVLHEYLFDGKYLCASPNTKPTPIIVKIKA